MAENPDNKNYVDLGPQCKQQVRSEETGEMVELSLDQRYLIPTQGMLRFIEREVMIEGTEVPKRVRILQQHQWCMETGEFGWYDIPLVDNEHQ